MGYKLLTAPVDIEYVFRDTHRDPETFRKRFDADIERNFMSIFGPRAHMGGMWLPITEAIDSLCRIVDTCDGTSSPLLIHTYAPTMFKGSESARQVANSMLELALLINEENSIDVHNDQMKIIRGIGRIARALSGKEREYWDNGGPSMAQFLSRVVVILKEHLKSNAHLPAADICDMIPHIDETVVESTSMKQAADRLEIKLVDMLRKMD